MAGREASLSRDISWSKGMESTDRARQLRRRIFFIVTNVVSIICLLWTLHGANLTELRHEVAHLDWRWLAAGMVFDVMVYTWQAWRWILVLKPVKTIAWWDCVRSIY